jgi:hypothetical protein
MRTKRRNHALAALALLLSLPSCGGGGSFDDLYPIRVPTDVLVSDIDGESGVLLLLQSAAEPGSFAGPRIL